MVLTNIYEINKYKDLLNYKKGTLTKSEISQK